MGTDPIASNTEAREVSLTPASCPNPRATSTPLLGNTPPLPTHQLKPPGNEHTPLILQLKDPGMKRTLASLTAH